MFIENYKATYKWLATKHDLARIYKRIGELLWSYIHRFLEVRNRIPNILKAKVITYFCHRLYHHDDLRISSIGSYQQ